MRTRTYVLKPNFFIVGAPKCGTTALSTYLRRNPKIGFSNPKEPHYFCTDYQRYRGAYSEKEYLDKYFSFRSDKYSAIGEASVWYLYSKHAIQNILEFLPNAKFIVMLRNPIKMVHSLHSQCLRTLDEDVEDFEQAWRLQSARAAGQRIPKRCREPAFLEYKGAGSYGEQLERMLKVIDRGQIKIILFDDFVTHTEQLYREVLEFLGVEYDGQKDFPIINGNRVNKSTFLARVAKHRPTGLMRGVNKIKRSLGIHSFGIGGAITQLEKRVNSEECPRSPLRNHFEQELLSEFRDDIRKLETLVNRDLSSWRAREYRTTPSA